MQLTRWCATCRPSDTLDRGMSWVSLIWHSNGGPLSSWLRYLLLKRRKMVFVNTNPVFFIYCSPHNQHGSRLANLAIIIMIYLMIFCADQNAANGQVNQIFWICSGNKMYRCIMIIVTLPSLIKPWGNLKFTNSVMIEKSLEHSYWQVAIQSSANQKPCCKIFANEYRLKIWLFFINHAPNIQAGRNWTPDIGVYAWGLR